MEVEVVVAQYSRNLPSRSPASDWPELSSTSPSSSASSTLQSMAFFNIEYLVSNSCESSLLTILRKVYSPTWMV